MIVLPPYVYDREAYPLIPVEDRWVLNKLQLAERLGYACGPTGVAPPTGRDLCVRPIMNMFGNGEGGFYKFNSDNPSDIAGLSNRPGYFWCEWFDGPFTFTEFINDVPRWSIVTTTDQSGLNEYEETTNHVVLPDFLKGLSRYLYVEAIGDKIIEVSFRLGPVNARQEGIDDYRTIDPTYSPTDIEFGLVDARKAVAKPYIQRGHYWSVLENTRRPFAS